jgi:hypothetical protein
LIGRLASAAQIILGNTPSTWYVLSLHHEEHTEALRAFHQMSAGLPNGLATRNTLDNSTFNKNSSAAKRLNCSL